MRFISLLFAVMLTGCSTIQGWIPSFSDANQSRSIIDLRLSIEQLDCTGDQLAQAERIRANIRWFLLYSESKGRRQQDVIRVVEPLEETVNDMIKRSRDHQGSKGYCEIKKKIMAAQAERASAAVLGRF